MINSVYQPHQQNTINNAQYEKNYFSKAIDACQLSYKTYSLSSLNSTNDPVSSSSQKYFKTGRHVYIPQSDPNDFADKLYLFNPRKFDLSVIKRRFSSFDKKRVGNIISTNNDQKFVRSKTFQYCRNNPKGKKKNRNYSDSSLKYLGGSTPTTTTNSLQELCASLSERAVNNSVKRIFTHHYSKIKGHINTKKQRAMLNRQQKTLFTNLNLYKNSLSNEMTSDCGSSICQPTLVDERGYACKLKRYQHPGILHNEKNSREDNEDSFKDNQGPSKKLPSKISKNENPPNSNYVKNREIFAHTSDRSDYSLRDSKKNKSFRNAKIFQHISTTANSKGSVPDYKDDIEIISGSSIDTDITNLKRSEFKEEFSRANKKIFSVHRLVVECSMNFRMNKLLSSFLPFSRKSFRSNSYEKNRWRKTLLDNISLEVFEGEMLLLLGNKSCGISLLFKVLMDCNTVNNLDIFGKFSWSGTLVSRSKIKYLAAHIKNDPNLIDFLTVEEMFIYFATLHNIRDPLEKKEKVEKVINDLKLTNQRNNFVGSCSKDDLVLVKIGCQLLLDREIIFFEEPEEGLDQHQQNFVIDYFKELSAYGKIIICSMPNPSFGTFLAFNKASILSNGCMVYYGTTRNLITYFESIGYRSPCFTNPCDFYVDLATIDYYSIKSFEKSLKRVKILQELCTSNCLKNLQNSLLDEMNQICGDFMIKYDKKSWWNQNINMIL
ncbi:unnamed protein product [Gordionus sp. m RMFG-2023]